MVEISFSSSYIALWFINGYNEYWNTKRMGPKILNERDIRKVVVFV